MKYRLLSLLFALILVAGCDSDSGDSGSNGTDPDTQTQSDTAPAPDTSEPSGDTTPTPDQAVAATCWIESHASGAIVSGNVQFTVGYDFPASLVQLLVDGVVVADSDQVSGSAGTTPVTWETDADGTFEVTARAESTSGLEAVSEAITVTVDNTPPGAVLGLERFTVARGNLTVPVTVDEENVDKVALVDRDGTQLTSVHASVTELVWRTTLTTDGVHWVHLEVSDVSGFTAVTDEIPVVIVNNGLEVPVEYIPGPWIYIPPDYMFVEHHTRIMANTLPNVRQVITWLIWDPTDDWQFEYSLGQGFCPHNGIQYTLVNDDSGEILIELSPGDLTDAVLAAIAALDPIWDPASGVFPICDNPRTFGSFFGHIGTLNPADHIDEQIDIDVHHVFLY